MMDLQEATLAMAAFMKGEHDFFKEHLEGFKPETEEEVSRYTTAFKEFEWMQSHTREFGNQLAADPNFFDIMESWRVVITGAEGVSKDSVKDALKADDVEDLLERCGTLATNIKSYIRNKGLMICDMSAGENGWDIAVRCSDKHSKLLCEDIYRRYNKALNLELIKISRRFAGHCLPGLYNWEDAIRMINTIEL